MKTETPAKQSIETFEIAREIQISAPIEIAFEAVLEQLSKGEKPGGGESFPMKLEAFPGGRWYRDLGNNSGHVWGHVQSIKRPTLLEIWGPLMMSYAAVNNVQYRLKSEGGVTRLTFHHRCMGVIPSELREGMTEGWTYWMERMRELAERKHHK
jgi:uncharacterized protein YndB with AHSA1/START domain